MIAVLFLSNIFNLIACKEFITPSGQCASEFWQLQHSYVGSTLFPPKLAGQWVSTRCESRANFNFLLRDYHFLETGNFVLRQYFYSDHFCSMPKFSIKIEGNLLHSSEKWDMPGAFEGSFSVKHVSVVAYSKDIAKHLTQQLREKCRLHPEKPFSWPSMAEFDSYSIFNDEEEEEESMSSAMRVGCLQALNITVDELRLIRMQENVGNLQDNSLTESPFAETLLYFGRLVHNSRKQAFLSPDSFQPALINAYEVAKCKICNRIRIANSLKPPVLSARSQKLNQFADLLPRLHGSWISQQCESVSNGRFTLRQLQLDSQRMRWRIRQRYYRDPFCKTPLFNVAAFGKLVPGAMVAQLHNAVQHFVLNVRRIRVTPESLQFADIITKGCRRFDKQPTSPNEVLQRPECTLLGAPFPRQIFESLLVEQSNADGSSSGTVLFTGDRESSDSFPTGFSGPLLKCKPEETTVIVSVKSGQLLSSQSTVYSSRLISQANVHISLTSALHLLLMIVLLQLLNVH